MLQRYDEDGNGLVEPREFLRTFFELGGQLPSHGAGGARRAAAAAAAAARVPGGGRAGFDLARDGLGAREPNPGAATAAGGSSSLSMHSSLGPGSRQYYN